MTVNVLVFSNDTLFKAFPSVDEMFPVTDIMRNKGEMFYLYVVSSSTWYKHYSVIVYEDVPAVYRTLKLMLTN